VVVSSSDDDSCVVDDSSSIEIVDVNSSDSVLSINSVVDTAVEVEVNVVGMSVVVVDDFIRVGALLGFADGMDVVGC